MRVTATYQICMGLKYNENLFHTSNRDVFSMRVTSGMLLSLLCCYLTLANERFSETPSHMEYWVLEQVSEWPDCR